MVPLDPVGASGSSFARGGGMLDRPRRVTAATGGFAVLFRLLLLKVSREA
jgi:hypothetical protein